MGHDEARKDQMLPLPAAYHVHIQSTGKERKKVQDVHSDVPPEVWFGAPQDGADTP